MELTEYHGAIKNNVAEQQHSKWKAWVISHTVKKQTFIYKC